MTVTVVAKFLLKVLETQSPEKDRRLQLLLGKTNTLSRKIHLTVTGVKNSDRRKEKMFFQKKLPSWIPTVFMTCYSFKILFAYFFQVLSIDRLGVLSCKLSLLKVQRGAVSYDLNQRQIFSISKVWLQVIFILYFMEGVQFFQLSMIAQNKKLCKLGMNMGVMKLFPFSWYSSIVLSFTRMYIRNRSFFDSFFYYRNKLVVSK